MNDSEESNHDEMEDMGERTHGRDENKHLDDTVQHGMMDHSMKGQAHDDHSMDGPDHGDHSMDGHVHGMHDHVGHDSSMIKDFKNRFWVCLVLTVPVFFLTPIVQELLGIGPFMSSTNDNYLLFALSSYGLLLWWISIFQGIN